MRSSIFHFAKVFVGVLIVVFGTLSYAAEIRPEMSRSLEVLMISFDEIERGAARDVGLVASKDVLKAQEVTWNAYTELKRSGKIDMPDLLYISLQRHFAFWQEETAAKEYHMTHDLSRSEKELFQKKAINARIKRLSVTNDYVVDLVQKFSSKLGGKTHASSCGSVF